MNCQNVNTSKNLNVNLNNFPSTSIRRMFSYFFHCYFKTTERTKFTQFVSFCLCTIFVRYFSFPLHCSLRPYVCHLIFIFYLLFIFTIWRGFRFRAKQKFCLCLSMRTWARAQQTLRFKVRVLREFHRMRMVSMCPVDNTFVRLLKLATTLNAAERRFNNIHKTEINW